MRTLAKCPYCDTEIFVEKDQETDRCSVCGRPVTTEEAIHKRNAEIMFKSPNEEKYKSTRVQKFVASIVCIFVCLGSWKIVEPEIYKLTSDSMVSLIITVILAITVCNIVFRFCTK